MRDEGMVKGRVKSAHGPTLIAIVGASASGKTFLAQKLAKKLGRSKTAIILQDNYYKDWSSLPLKEREKINFDSPKAFDFQLFLYHLKRLKKGESIEVPQYSFSRHKRLSKRYPVSVKPCIIVEGLLALHKKSVRGLFDIKVYVDIDNATSLSRRIKRDIQHRGETIETVCKRYFEDVLPMQEKFVEPQKKWADVAINGCNSSNPKLFSKLLKIIRE